MSNKLLPYHMDYFAPRETLKTCSIVIYIVDVFLSYLRKNSIGHLLRTSRDSFRPPPPQKFFFFRKEMDSILLYFSCTFSRSICCVCRTLTKIWPKNIEFYRYSYNIEERAFVFAPSPFTPIRSDRCNLIFIL